MPFSLSHLAETDQHSHCQMCFLYLLCSQPCLFWLLYLTLFCSFRTTSLHTVLLPVYSKWKRHSDIKRHLKQKGRGGYSSTATFVLIPQPSVIGLNIWICLLFTLLLEVVEAATKTHLMEDLIIFVSLLHSLPTLLFVFAYTVRPVWQGCYAYFKKQPKTSPVLQICLFHSPSQYSVF